MHASDPRIDPGAFAAALAEATESLVCVLDRDGRVLAFNDACERATGFRAADVLGRDARDLLIPAEEARAFGEFLAGVWATAQPSPQVGHWLTRDGGRLLIAWSNKPVLGDGRTPLYLVTSGRDITERERVDAERRALEGDLDAKLAEVGRLAQEQSSLRRVATLVAAEVSPERLFTAVSEQCARVLGTEAAAVFRYEGDVAVVVGRHDRAGIEAFPLGSRVPLSPWTAIGRVHASGEPARIDDYSELPGEAAEIMRRAGLRATVAAPIVVAGAVWGAVAVTSRITDRIAPEGESRLRDFCELASLAIASAEAREQLRASRERIVRATDEERRRLERNLHDGAQQRLVSLALSLQLARRLTESDPGRAATVLEAASRELDGALEELRELARGLHPGVLSERGLAPALEALAERAPLRVEIGETPAERLPESVEIAAYYIVSEALTNVAKHARASRATVRVSEEESCALVEVCDDGRGGADFAAGSGIVGLRDRAEALGGSLALESPPDGGTTLRARLPVTARDRRSGRETGRTATPRS